MLTANRDLMQQARESLKGNWTLAVIGNAIYLILLFLVQGIPLIGWIGGLVIGGPLTLGWTIFFLNLVRRQEAQLAQLFDGFYRFVNAFLAYLLMILFIFLWSLLLLIPGIVAFLSYSMTFFILTDHPEMEGLVALRNSKVLMKGNRWKLFCLFWRFLGWFLLGVLSLGIGFLWIVPYLQTALAQFYDDVKKDSANPQLVFGSPQPIHP